MKIVVCFKVVPDDQEIKIQANGALSFDRAPLVISNYDLNAIEAGVQMVEANGHDVMGVSVGNAKINDSKLKKNALSRGLASLFMIADEKLSHLDTYQTANALKAAIDKISGVDLVLCGEGSADLYAQQVGVQLGQLMGASTVNSVNKITEQDGKLIVERVLENEVEVLEVGLPAVLSVTSYINSPRIPSMKNILAAGKKVSTIWTVADAGHAEIEKSIDVLETKAPDQADRKKEMMEANSAEQIQAFVDKISAELK